MPELESPQWWTEHTRFVDQNSLGCNHSEGASRILVVTDSSLGTVESVDATSAACLALGAILGPSALGGMYADADGELHARLVSARAEFTTATSDQIEQMLIAANEFPTLITVDVPEIRADVGSDAAYRRALAHRRSAAIAYWAAAFFGLNRDIDHVRACARNIAA